VLIKVAAHRVALRLSSWFQLRQASSPLAHGHVAPRRPALLSAEATPGSNLSPPSGHSADHRVADPPDLEGSIDSTLERRAHLATQLGSKVCSIESVGCSGVEVEPASRQGGEASVLTMDKVCHQKMRMKMRVAASTEPVGESSRNEAINTELYSLPLLDTKD
jgi:hypothetical protein